MTTAQTKFYATLEVISSTLAIVELRDESGAFFGAGRVERRAGSNQPSLYDLGYSDASVRASIHGGRLETFKRVAA